jgi:hypothetical protein
MQQSQHSSVIELATATKITEKANNYRRFANYLITGRLLLFCNCRSQQKNRHEQKFVPVFKERREFA